MVWNPFIEIVIELRAIQFCCLHVRSVGLGIFTSCAPINFRTLSSQKKYCAPQLQPSCTLAATDLLSGFACSGMSRNVLTREVGLCAGSFLSVLAFTDWC